MPVLMPDLASGLLWVTEGLHVPGPSHGLGEHKG